jgi:hypothetical protein
MKKILLSCTLLISIAIFSKALAQCTPYNFQSIIKNISVNNVTNIATATLDVSFNINANNGNKFIFIHLWSGSDYQNVNFAWGASGQKAPSPTDLNGAGNSHPTIFNLAIDNAVSQTYRSTYVYSAMTLQQPASAPIVQHLASGADSFVIKDVVVSFPSSQLQVLGSIISGVIWSSNSNSYSSSMSVQCFLSGATFLADPVVSGSGSCGTGTYSLTIAHNSLVQGNTLSGSFDVYADADANGLFSAIDDVKITNAAVPFSVSAANPITNYYTGSQNFSGGIPALYNGRNLFVVVTSGSSTVTQFMPTTQCSSTLPVTFKSFNVARNNQTVAIKWETAFEQNNRGFYIQRNVNGEWKDIAFVFSKAESGNSSGPLSYTYNDPNNLNTVSYYRILQVDLSGLGKYSQVGIIRGGQDILNKMKLFPNPGTNGKVNVLFDDETSVKNVIVYDASGRAVKSLKSIVGASLTIDQLKPGIYSIQVVNAASQIVSSEKFIIRD